jgi:hypothetical protein
VVGLYSAGLILNNVVGYWVYISVSLYSGGYIRGEANIWGGAYIWGAYIWIEVLYLISMWWAYIWQGLYCIM